MASRSISRKPATKGRHQAAGKKADGSLTRFILIVAMLAWAFRSLAVAPFSIPSGSMLPTLYIGDYLLVEKWPYGYSRFSFPFAFPPFSGRILGGLPQRGDVVVFRHPTEQADLIKRVIGLPGDRIELRGGRVILNGLAVPDAPLPAAAIPLSPNSPCRVIPPASPDVAATRRGPSCLYRAYLETLPGGPSFTVLDQVDHGAADDFAEVQVPTGHVFLMGDNRDDSLDSRFQAESGGVGMVPTQNLIGRAMVTFWSTDGRASWRRPWTWFPALRVSRVGNSYDGEAQ